MVRVTTTWGALLKGCSIRMVGNHRSRLIPKVIMNLKSLFQCRDKRAKFSKGKKDMVSCYVIAFISMLPCLIKILHLGCVAWLGLSSTCLGSRRIQVQPSEPSQRNRACQHAHGILGLGVQSQEDLGGLLVSGPGSLANSRSVSAVSKRDGQNLKNSTWDCPLVSACTQIHMCTHM